MKKEMLVCDNCKNIVAGECFDECSYYFGNARGGMSACDRFDIKPVIIVKRAKAPSGQVFEVQLVHGKIIQMLQFSKEGERLGRFKIPVEKADEFCSRLESLELGEINEFEVEW